MAMPLPVAAETGRQVQAPAAGARRRDGILHRTVGQPAGVAPIQTVLPGGEELLKRGQRGLLVLARLLGLEEVESVASSWGVIGEHHTYVEGEVHCGGLIVMSHKEMYRWWLRWALLRQNWNVEAF